ncbi:NarK/NasA family nitrate transporter [Streptomyces sp. NBC_01306]|uniref:nitrate/nitrite transporter n=1 Tax=Streptomyces sp. NBC_01306 TaxID=2903819 RepID=UPI0022516059|nr:NarK/NasA family nitrate transporter [Streptomyces sp. NBC_01306]MCX4728432.1 NarK/NasA family nitrate transporter [Streptomyces sp. NBC_01306]
MGTATPIATPPPAPTAPTKPTASAYRNLVLATIGFTLTFWAWSLIAPLGSDYKDRLGLSSFQQSLLVAAPVIVGSLGRIPVGALTDRYGAKVMFPLVTAFTIVPVLLLIPAKNSYGALLAVGFLLGLGGTTFAIGIPLVNSWFPPAERGLALGVFGMGMGGVALSGYFTTRIAEHGVNLPFIVVAIALAAFAVLGALLITDHPDRQVPTTTLATRLGSAGRLRVTWELSALYAIGFGGIVAFGVYLPTYLKTWYNLSPTDAGTKAAGFALVTVVFRPVGGRLADLIHPAVVTAGALALVALMAIVQAFDPQLNPTGTVCLLLMAAGLGTASGSVFALVSQVTPQPQVGSVTGIVGAMGGLGGFVPPLVMGAIYSAKGTYSIGFMLLSDLSLAGCVYAFGRMRTIRPSTGGTTAGRSTAGRSSAGGSTPAEPRSARTPDRSET